MLSVKVDVFCPNTKPLDLAHAGSSKRSTLQINPQKKRRPETSRVHHYVLDMQRKDQAVAPVISGPG